MFSYLKKNPAVKAILAVLIYVAVAQIIVLELFFRSGPGSYSNIVLIAVLLTAAIPLIYYLFMRLPAHPASGLETNHLSTNSNAPPPVMQEKTDRSDSAVPDNDQTQSRFSELKKNFLQQCQDLDELVAWLPCPVFLIDDRLQILNCNENALNLFGYESRDQITSFSFSDLFVNPGLLNLHSLLTASDKRHKLKSAMLRNDGSAIDAGIFLLPDRSMRGPENSFFVCIEEISPQGSPATDENQQHSGQGVFFHNIESVSRLAGGIAHDFNNILGAISGYAEIISKCYSTDEKLQKYARMILSATGRAAALTQKLLQFARKNQLSMSCFDVNDPLSLLPDIFSDSQSLIQIKYQLNAENSCIYGDPSQFQNAITNVATNARDSMPDGGVLIVKTENLDVSEKRSGSHLFTIAPGYYIAISFSDCGTGISQQDLSRLFEPFYTSKDKAVNTGLGLACVYGIMKSHNGFIDVQSIPGTGTTFTLYFPVCTGQLPPEIDAGSRGSSADEFTKRNSSGPQGKKILLADDEPVISEALKEMLVWLGFSVTCAGSGDEAVELVKKSPFGYDLVILDMAMPGMDSQECFTRIRELNKDIKVLITTGNCKENGTEQLLQMGVSGILTKPFDASKLTQAIYGALNREAD